MKPADLSRPFLFQARHLLLEVHLPRVEACLRKLAPEQIWWSANSASNSAGNLVLHLEGNVRQWIVAGLGGRPYRRERDREFSESGPIPGRALLTRLRRAVRDGDRVLRKLDAAGLARSYTIQGFQVTGLDAVFHVVEHFSQHSGQIILLTKMLAGKDLKFTRLPGEKKRRGKARSLPAV